jgi:hypothetical protein
MEMRNIYIALIVAVAILLPGMAVFRHDDTASQVVVIVAFTVGILVLHSLDARHRRQEGRE